MKVCIIGGGVAGLYTAKRLLQHQINVNLYDKSPYGKIKTHFLDKSYINNLKPTVENLSLNLINENVNKLCKLNCDAFVIATGAEPNKLKVKNGNYALCSDKIIKWCNGENEKIKIGREIGIIGFGDVTIDILKVFTNPQFYLKDVENRNLILEEIKKIEKITVFSRSGPLAKTVKNSELRELSKNAFLINANRDFWKFPLNFLKLFWNKSDRKRNEIYENSSKNGIPILIKFNSKIDKLVKNEEKIGVDDGKIHYFDTVISSIGYKENVNVDLTNVTKPVFFVGACKSVKGDVASIIRDANLTADTIFKLIKNNNLK